MAVGDAVMGFAGRAGPLAVVDQRTGDPDAAGLVVGAGRRRAGGVLDGVVRVGGFGRRRGPGNRC